MNDHARDMAHRARPEVARQFILREEDQVPAHDGADADGHDQNVTTLSEAYATVVAETRTEIASLTVGEAVMRMDLADQAVMMFRNSTSGTLNVVYRRPDGHIGWIDPGD